MYADDWLRERLVLKGGNALSLVYKIGDRTSLDLDFSIEGDFDDVDSVSSKIENALVTTFEQEDIVVFDFILTPKPESNTVPWWGGYQAEFKLIPRPVAYEASMRVEDMRRRALTVDPGSQRRKYIIQISKFEYAGAREERNVGGFFVRVYPPVLLSAEKLRALVQQHPEYEPIPSYAKRSRARDFYDIWAICEHFAIKLDMHLDTVRAVFDAKGVDLVLLGKLKELKALHMASWADVELAISSHIESFDYYFDYVVAIAENLYTQWKEHTP